MYCSRCGAQNELNSKFCAKCGNNLNEMAEEVDDKKLKSINRFSIASFILSFLLPPIGLILSIIGLVRCNKYKKETNEKVGYLAFNIVGIIISIVITFIILLVAIIVFGVFTIFKGSDEILKSTWECKMSPFSSTKVVTVKFDGKDFMWGKYGDEENNNFSGKYYILDREYTNGKNEYSIDFRPNYYIVSGKKSYNYPTSQKMEIEFDEKRATITSSNSARYYCERK
ncbi:MAG: zinc ribbon domain-containing protein [Bacilli bacterium]|nr:zinc ribbon domain-containing protein [Bacilli bacterium]